MAEHNRVNEALIQGTPVPQEARSVSVSLDRVSVPMEEPKKRPRGRPRKGAPRKPVDVACRMAYTATVTLHDDTGKALHTVRYGRMPGGDADDLCAELSGDVQALRAKRPDLKVVNLVDGAPEMVNRLRAHVNEQELGTPVEELVDFWHLVEKLAAAAAVVHGAKAEEAVNRWRLLLLNHSQTALEILDELHRSGKERVPVGKERPVHDAITYLTNNHERMNYAARAARACPSAAGTWRPPARASSRCGSNAPVAGGRTEPASMSFSSARWRSATDGARPSRSRFSPCART